MNKVSTWHEHFLKFWLFLNWKETIVFSLHFLKQKENPCEWESFIFIRPTFSLKRKEFVHFMIFVQITLFLHSEK